MRLDTLPRGITGFCAPQGISVDAKKFTASCYQVAQAGGGKIRSVIEDLHIRNYFAAILTIRDCQISVLCNSVFPYIAFVSSDEYCFHELTFVAPSPFFGLFEDLTPFSPLDADWLESDIEPEHLALLGDDEVNQLTYWKKSARIHRVGDVIFNFWD